MFNSGLGEEARLVLPYSTDPIGHARRIVVHARLPAGLTVRLWPQGGPVAGDQANCRWIARQFARYLRPIWESAC